jgi:hypothetical protein
MYIIVISLTEHGHSLIEIIFLWITDGQTKIKYFGFVCVNDDFADFSQRQGEEFFMILNNETDLILNLVFSFFS